MKRICRENEQCVGGPWPWRPTGDTCDVETAMQPPPATRPTPVPKSRRPHRGACLLPKVKKNCKSRIQTPSLQSLPPPFKRLQKQIKIYDLNP
jgi:hypothetical protein